MLPKREVLARLMRSNTSFMLYGQKASGKTSLIHSLLKETDTKYIEINCTLANKRSNFLKLFRVELHKYLKAKEAINEHDGSVPVNLDTWINDLKRITYGNSRAAEQLDKLYIFMDNIEQMNISENFLPSFYAACQKEFEFKFSFIFCGINFQKKEYALELPFRTMIAFCMPKPVEQIQKTILKAVECSLREAFKERHNSEQMQKCIKLLSGQIKAAFQNIQLNLEKMKIITKSIVDQAVGYFDEKDLYKSISRAINTGMFKDLISQVREYGPLQEGIMKRKVNSLDREEESLDVNTYLEYYPNLILASIHLADYYTEKEDKRRFQDYKSKTSSRNKDIKRSDFKVGRHNLNRIIAIADSLESQAKDNDKEKALEHHSLDFYAQFEHLRKINRIRITGNKLTGVVKQEDVKAFLSKNELRYEQFMSN